MTHDRVDRAVCVCAMGALLLDCVAARSGGAVKALRRARGDDDALDFATPWQLVGTLRTKSTQVTGSAACAYPEAIEFQALGPVPVSTGGRRHPLGGPKQRTMLASLVHEVARTVSGAAFITGVYGVDASGGARRTIYT